MDYTAKFTELRLENNRDYPYDDIGISKLFADIHKNKLCYVVEAKVWCVYDGQHWLKDDGLAVMEICKEFVQAYRVYLNRNRSFDDECDDFTEKLCRHGKRASILNDAKSVAPMRFSAFDESKLLFNCSNGTFDLAAMTFRPHSPGDYLTKLSRAEYNANASCMRWDRFISEVLCCKGSLKQLYYYTHSSRPSVAIRERLKAA